MKNVSIINAHEPWPFSEGKLNGSLVKRAAANLKILSIVATRLI